MEKPHAVYILSLAAITVGTGGCGTKSQQTLTPMAQLQLHITNINGSPIIVSEGSIRIDHYSYNGGTAGLTLSNGNTVAAADETGYIPLYFYLSDCTSQPCAFRIESGWSASVYDSSNTYRELWQEIAGPKVQITDKAGDMFMSDPGSASGHGVMQPESNNRLDHFVLTNVNGQPATLSCKNTSNPAACRVIITYCTSGTYPDPSNQNDCN